MTLAELLAVVTLAALVIYALLGGADFGGGVWDALATGPRARRQRDLIAEAIGPIWEANHVWLILVVVLLFSAFPTVFSAIMTWLHVPITILLVGIVLRGSAFVFRAYDARQDEVHRRWSRVFSISSIAAPVLLGVVIGTISTPALATGIPGSAAEFFTPWLRPFPWAVGLFALALFAFLAATYLTVEAPEAELKDDFRDRALASAIVVGVLAATVILLGSGAAPGLIAALLGSDWSLPLQIATGAAAIGAIAALWHRRFLVARLLAATQVTLILVGWGLALSPWMIFDRITIEQAAAPVETLRVISIALGAGALVLLPALFYLFRTFKGGVLLGAEGGAPGSGERVG